jgi:hypothetical protein
LASFPTTRLGAKLNVQTQKKGQADMISSDRNRGYLAKLKANPLDLRSHSAQDAAQALYDFIQRHFTPGDECSLLSPTEADLTGVGPHWTVSWEAGPAEWGVLLSLGESMWLTELDLKHDHRPEVLLQRGNGWFAEPYFRFDVGFIER